MATLPLLAHLGHPERALNIVITPHFTSAMSAFGMIYGLYLVLVLVEIWLIYRKEIIEMAPSQSAASSAGSSRSSLWAFTISPRGPRHRPARSIVLLAGLGIPAACILHGYVGFMFGSVKANAFWSTPLMPIIFLFSAVTSGIAMILVLYEILTKVGGRKIDGACVQSLAQWLWLFATVTVTLELLEIISLSYDQDEEWLIVGPLISDKIAVSFIGVQMIFGSLIPFILLAIVVLMRRYLTDTLRTRHLLHRRVHPADPGLRHALERGHRRADLLQERNRLPRKLRSRTGRPRRGGHGPFDPDPPLRHHAAVSTSSSP